MSTGRKILLILLALGLLILAILTWGSVGSLTSVLCLILMGLSLLYNRFINNREDDYFVE